MLNNKHRVLLDIYSSLRQKPIIVELIRTRNMCSDRHISFVYLSRLFFIFYTFFRKIILNGPSVMTGRNSTIGSQIVTRK